MDAINDNIELQLHICYIVQYIISTRSFAQYQIIFLHYCDNWSRIGQERDQYSMWWFMFRK